MICEWTLWWYFRMAWNKAIIESLRFLKRVLSFISLVNILLRLMMPGICSTLKSFDWWHSRNHVFSEIYMFNSFICECSWPLEEGLVVFVYCGPTVCFHHSDIIGMMFERLKLFSTFSGSHYLFFAGSEGCIILDDKFPGNETTRSANQKTRWWKKFESFYRGDFINWTTTLTAPSGVE